MTEDALLAALQVRVAVQATDDSKDALGFAPLTSAQVDRLEGTVPPLLLRLFRTIGNGGWGPGYGLYPLVVTPEIMQSSPLPDFQTSSLDWTRSFAQDQWPQHLLFLAYWGCTVHSVLDLHTGRVGVFDFSGLEDVHMLAGVEQAIFWQCSSLHDWFESWNAGADLFFPVDELDEEG